MWVSYSPPHEEGNSSLQVSRPQNTYVMKFVAGNDVRHSSDCNFVVIRRTASLPLIVGEMREQLNSGVTHCREFLQQARQRTGVEVTVGHIVVLLVSRQRGLVISADAQ